MLARLTRGWVTVTELAEPYDVSLPAVSKHLQVLEKAGLIERHVQGRVHYLRLLPSPLEEAIEWLDFHRAFWEAQFDSLADFLKERDQEDSGV